MSEAPLDRGAVREAARWFMCLQEQGADQARFEQWRSAHPDHERAWQLAQRVSQQWQPIPPGMGLPTLGRADRLSRRAGLKALLLLMTAGPLGLAAWRGAQWTADERTAIGEQRELRLPDGTYLMLDTATALNIQYDADQRLIRLLAGEILVITAADALGRPLRVQTDQGSVSPVGTRFSVRQEGADSRVCVYAGAVDLQPRHSLALTRLEAGQQARFDSTTLQDRRPLGADRGDWAHGVLTVERMPLAQFAQELNRYRVGWVRCDEQVSTWLISGAFQLRDTDLILQAVAQALPVAVNYRTRYWVTLTTA